MSKVLLIIHSLSAGGAERALTELADGLCQQGLAVDLATWDLVSREDFYPLNPAVRRIRLRTAPGAQRGLMARCAAGIMLLPRLRQIIRSSGADTVISFVDISNVVTILAAAGLGRNIVVCERTDPGAANELGWTWRLARRISYRHATTVVAQTEQAAGWLRQLVHGDRVRVIPNFIRRLPAPADERTKTIISVGRLVPVKGFDDAIRAFAAAGAHHAGWKYVLLGEGSQRKALEQLANQLGVRESIEFAGVVKNVEEWLGRASICLQPSRFEGFPNAVLEAMGMGVATVSANCRSGPADLITHGFDGYLVGVRDWKAMADVLRSLIDDVGTRTTVGQHAMAVRERFSSKRVLTLWRDAIDQRQAQPLIKDGEVT